MANAGSGRDPAEARIGEDGNVFAERQRLQCRRDLVYLLHARTGRPTADEHHHIVFYNVAALNGVDRGLFSSEHFCGPKVAILLIGVDQRRINRGALDDRAFRRKVTNLSPSPS